MCVAGAFGIDADTDTLERHEHRAAFESGRGDDHCRRLFATVGKFGYSTMFFGFAGCTVIYFLTAAASCPKPKAGRWRRSRRISREEKKVWPSCDGSPSRFGPTADRFCTFAEYSNSSKVRPPLRSRLLAGRNVARPTYFRRLLVANSLTH